MEKMVDKGNRGKGARGRAAGSGVGNLALRGHVAVCNWPRLAMVAGQP